MKIYIKPHHVHFGTLLAYFYYFKLCSQWGACLTVHKTVPLVVLIWHSNDETVP